MTGGRGLAPVALFALTMLPCGSAVAADTGVPDAATIRANVRSSAGPLPAAYRETDVTTTSNGQTTIERDFRLAKDVRYVFDTGPFHTEHGENGGTAWHMNDNGQVVVEEPDPGRATPEVTRTTVAAIDTPVHGYTIATLNAQGHGTKDYVDAATWRLVQRDTITANGTIVRTFDDFRADHGRTFAHHQHVENGYARTTSDLRVDEFLPGAVAPADVAMPPPRRALVEFPAGVSSVELPTQFGRSHVAVRVMIGGRGLDFILDTGASGIFIDTKVARELGLPGYGRRSAVTAGRYDTARTIVPEMRVGSLVMRNVAVQEVPQGWNAGSGVKEVGLLGFDFLAELGVTIDYEHERVTVVPSAAYVPPNAPHTFPIDVRVGAGVPLVTVAVNGAIGERWTIDTGGAGTFLIFDYFARRHPEAMRDQLGGGAGRQANLYGIGGPIDARAYQIASLRLANIDFQGFLGYRVNATGGYSGNGDGLIGSDFLRLFTIGFDYADGRAYFVPNALGRGAMGLH